MNERPTIGVLALQGAFAAHAERLASLGVDVVEVRRPVHLEGLDGIILPGGESTAMSNLMKSSGLVDDLSICLRNGLPAFGTCAGMILLAEEIKDGRPDQISLEVLPIAVRRNGYGRQIDSFECDLALVGHSTPFHAVFIRAPKIESLDQDVEVLATHVGIPVLVRRGSAMASSFHPELTDDSRIHEIFLGIVEHHRSNIHVR